MYILCGVGLLFILIIGNSQSSSDYSDTKGYQTSSTYSPSYNIYNSTTSLHSATKDWMKEQAKGKDFSKNDGGSYYCMGKNDTCPNKTHNAYDLYCSSCDPDGNNIEG